MKDSLMHSCPTFGQLKFIKWVYEYKFSPLSDSGKFIVNQVVRSGYYTDDQKVILNNIRSIYRQDYNEKTN